MKHQQCSRFVISVGGTETLSEFKEVYSCYFNKLTECGIDKPVSALIWKTKLV